MKLIAHRGLYKRKLEQNTLKAFYNAVNDDRFIGFECDIRQTKDKKYIINHDSIINEDLISITKYKDLNLLNQPKLTDVLNINTNKIILLEIKDINIDPEKINKILNKYNNKNIYVMSFHNSVLTKLNNLHHTYKIGSLNYIFNSINNYDYDFICLLNNLANKKNINKYLKLNKEVFIYGILNNKFIHGDKVYYINDYKKTL